MSVLASALTTLNNAKLILGVTGTAHDALLELLINRVSTKIVTDLSRKLARATYTEHIEPSSRTLLLLKEYPIVSVTSVSCDGMPLVLDTDYRCDAQDKARGQLYKENGWATSYLVRGLAQDPAVPTRSIDAVYVAGFYLPASAEYVMGAEDSLPLDLQQLADSVVSEQFFATTRQSRGLTSYSEGGISFGWKLSDELEKEYLRVINTYRRWIVG